MILLFLILLKLFPLFLTPQQMRTNHSLLMWEREIHKIGDEDKIIDQLALHFDLILLFSVKFGIKTLLDLALKQASESSISAGVKNATDRVWSSSKSSSFPKSVQQLAHLQIKNGKGWFNPGSKPESVLNRFINRFALQTIQSSIKTWFTT